LFQGQKELASSSHQQGQSTIGNDSFIGRRPYPRGRGGIVFGKCFSCNKYDGNRSYECPENPSKTQGNAHIFQSKE